MAAYRRSDLLELLAVAAELEHSLVCQYLFAAYSMRRTGLSDEQAVKVFEWERSILLVARQEMEHLGLVINLTTAVGGAPTLGRRDFPYPTPLFGHVMSLERFSATTVKKFVCFERPEDVHPLDAFCAESPSAAVPLGHDAPLTPLRLADDPSSHDPSTDDTAPYTTVQELYERIKTVLRELNGSTSELFIGPPDAQVTGGELGTDFPRLGALGAGYDVFMRPVTDLASAINVIDLVIEQGEGAPSGHEISHYERFMHLLHELEADPFDAAEPVVTDPSPATVSDPLARQVMGLFDDAYGLLLAILVRLFASTDETAADVNVLRSVGFMPLMTMVVRPLAEVLTTMPAHAPDDGTRAGPSFDIRSPVLLLPHRDAAWVVLSEALNDLATRSDAAAAVPGMPGRLAYISTSISLVARRFAAGLGMVGAP